MVRASSPTGGRPRDGHRLLRHLCAGGLVLCALTAARGTLPDLLRRSPFAGHPAGNNGAAIVFIITLLGLMLSWAWRHKSGRQRGRMLMLLGAAQAGYWVWQTLQGAEVWPVAFAGLVAGGMLAQSFAASSQRAYQRLQGMALVLLVLAGWHQTTQAYEELLAAALVLLVFSALAGRVSPAGVADVYVDTGYPGLPHTLVTGLLLLAFVGGAAYPFFVLLPRPTQKQREVVNGFANYYIEQWRTRRPELPPSPAKVQPRLDMHSPRLPLSGLGAPKPTGATFFVVQGPVGRAFRTAVLSDYDGRTWRGARKGTDGLTLVRGGEMALLNRSDGAWVFSGEMETYQVHVVSDLGASVPRPRGATQMEFEKRTLFRDGFGNLYAYPDLVPPLKYVVRTPSIRKVRSQRGKLDPAFLALPELPERVTRLVAELAPEGVSDHQAILAFIEWIRGHCAYRTGEHIIPAGREATDYLLFEAKEGWCVHFASALAVLCRARGIPSRVVTGYGPGVFNPLSRTYSVTDERAHAWIEARPSGGNWEEFDPTPVADSPLQQVAESLGEAGGWTRKAGAKLGSEWDDASAWATAVVTRVQNEPILLTATVLSVLLLGWLAVRMRSRTLRARRRRQWDDVQNGTPRSSARAAYALVAEHLAAQGYGEVSFTSPGEYLARLREEGSPVLSAVEFVIATYEATAFGPQVTMRWNRARLAERCRIVLGRISRWRQMSHRLRNRWRRRRRQRQT